MWACSLWSSLIVPPTELGHSDGKKKKGAQNRKEAVALQTVHYFKVFYTMNIVTSAGQTLRSVSLWMHLMHAENSP